MNKVEENTVQIITALDEDTALEQASSNYIDTLVHGKDYDVMELVAGMMTSVHQIFDEHNLIVGKSKGWKYPKILPNICLARLIAFKYNVKLIDSNGDVDNAMLSVYQDSGPNQGIYSIKSHSLKNIIRSFRPNATTRDIEEVKDVLSSIVDVVEPTRDKDLIAVNNGIFDYKNKRLLEFSPEYIFTAKIKVDYVPNAVRPTYVMHDGELWDPDTWFESLSDDTAIVKLLWQAVGAIIRPNVRWDKAIFLYSQVGMNGKGTLCELMKQLCGKGAYSSISLSSFEKDFALEELMTSTAIICDENGTSDFTKSAAIFKAICTADSFMLNGKGKKMRTVTWRGAVVECINSLPRISDFTDSLYRRVLIIPFDKTFKGTERKYIKDDYLRRKDCLEYILNKVLHTDYYEFDNPPACEEMLRDYKNFNDPVKQFVDDVFPQLAWDLIPLTFLKDLYPKWRIKHNPSAVQVGERTLEDRIATIIMNDYSTEWSYEKGKTYRVTKTNMCKPELLIHEYGLSDWENRVHKGCSIEQKCMPSELKDKYKGYVRNSTSNAVVDSEEV